LTRLDRPEELGPHLEANARAWQRILGVDASALSLFGRVSALSLGWAALQREALARLGINYAELAVLGMLRTSEPAQRRSPTELRALIGQSSAGTTRILDKLEADGHLRREDTAGDRRRIDVALTPRGAALAEAAFKAMLAVEAEVLAGIPAEQRAAIAAGLDMVLGALAARRG
jgi:DNA-binding MarR family transcriptional regulator